jgi:hypothetical protein
MVENKIIAFINIVLHFYILKNSVTNVTKQTKQIQFKKYLISCWENLIL